MAAGGPGNHPLSDIVDYKLDVYNAECDELIRQISKLVSMNQLYEMSDWFDNFNTTSEQLRKFEIILRERLEKLNLEALNSDWEI